MTNLAYNIEQQPRESVEQYQNQTLEVVDLDEMGRVEKRLIQLEKQELASSANMKKHIFFTNRKGRVTRKTLGQFLEKGLPYTAPGLNTILADSDWKSRLNGLQRLEALYELALRTSLQYEAMTEALVAEKRTQIQETLQNPAIAELYQPSKW